MGKYLYIFFVFNLICCSASKKVIQSKKYSEFEIVNTPLITNNDTVHIKELRFYKTQSAKDGIKLMYRSYGKWTQRSYGKYQENIDRFIWKDLKLIDDNDMTFTVIADGSESHHGYFASLMVLDSEKRDCFDSISPYKEKLTDLFLVKMGNLDKNSSIYRLFKK